MKLPSIDITNDTPSLLADINRYLDEAEVVVANQDMASLVGFDTVVDNLCKRVLVEDTLASKAYVPELEALIARLNRLQEKMGTLQQQVGEAIQKANVTQKANKAYNKKPRT